MTNEISITMFIGPTMNREPLEIAVITDDEGKKIIHAMPAQAKFLKEW